MNDKTIQELKKILNNDNKESSLIKVRSEINELMKLEYIATVMEWIDCVDEIISHVQIINKSGIELKLYIKKISSNNIHYLASDLSVDKHVNFTARSELNNFISKFTSDCVGRFFGENFSIILNLKNYDKENLKNEMLKNMLTDEMKLVIDFINLDNGIDNKKEINLKKKKI